ncbi:YcaO-like family protein [Streptomyces sp. NPDC056661]|uniref:YcaO-like family protein n=1 Tax=Streptomyces sp. NPDC056661 TaxID=3345898 RepID=UPI0036ACE84C
MRTGRLEHSPDSRGAESWREVPGGGLGLHPSSVSAVTPLLPHSGTDPTQDSDKTLVLGTHRATDAATTWTRIEPLLPRLGITRMADITMLDDIGVPVWQAIQPNAKSLSVAQGKGIDHGLARISAAMEALECWHAEHRNEPAFHACFRDLQARLGYRMDQLDLERPSLLTETLRIGWLNGTDLATGATTWVPHGCVNLDQSRPSTLNAPLFSASTNGLASGNTMEEATLHALLELLERDLVAHARRQQPQVAAATYLDLTSVNGPCSAMVLTRLLDAGVRIRVQDCSSEEVACFSAAIWSEDLPYVFIGSGCHFDHDVALSRALTEAAQSRLTAIAGTRDDLPTAIYRAITDNRSILPPWPDSPTRRISFDQTPTTLRPFLADDIAAAVAIITQRSEGIHPVRVDLTRHDIGVPVVHVTAPGLSREPH